MTTDEEITLLAALLRRPRSRLKAYARMRKRDRLIAAWAASMADPLVLVTNAVRFGIEEPLLEADREEREILLPWHARMSARVAREVVGEYSRLPTGSSLVAKEDTLVRITTKTAIDVLGGLGLVLLWEWVTQRDARVCDRCGPLDGQLMRQNLVAPLPLHPRCRCGLRPRLQTLT